MKIRHLLEPRRSKSILGLAAACAVLACSTAAHAVNPLVQWNFNSGDGANTGTIASGSLTLNAGTGATTGSIVSDSPSGAVGDSSLHTSNANDNWWGSDVGNAAAVGNLDLTTVNQFTITMWIKRSGGNNATLLDIGSTLIPDGSSNPGISIGLNGNWDNGIRFGVNGHNAWTGDLWNSGYDSEWVFLAIAYDGTDTYNVWDNSTMNGLYGQNANVAVITGGTSTSASVATGINLHTGDWWTPVGNVSLGSSSTAYLGNDGSNASGFSGNLDDVRIYDSLLTVPQIDAVRAEALAAPVPEPATSAMFVLGGLGMLALWRKGRRTTRV